MQNVHLQFNQTGRTPQNLQKLHSNRFSSIFQKFQKEKKKTDGDEERDRELNDGVIVHNIFIIDNQDDAKGDDCTDKSETVSLISNTEKQETGTKPEANPEATRNGPIAKIVADGVQFLYSEKEEMEAQKKQAEVFQLSQQMQFLYSTEIVMSPQDEEITAYHHQYPTESFRCLLHKEMMSDPVAIICRHSCERKSIQENF